MSKLREIFSGATGQLSSKRVSGFLLLVSGIAAKVGLIILGIFHIPQVPFPQLDGATESLIIAGSALLGGGLVELFAKKEKKEND